LEKTSRSEISAIVDEPDSDAAILGVVSQNSISLGATLLTWACAHFGYIVSGTPHVVDTTLVRKQYLPTHVDLAAKHWSLVEISRFRCRPRCRPHVFAST
jgi:hypothetical protein